MSNKRISVSNKLVKEYIVTALLQLIHKKTLSSITISELCKVAGVSRMSFYRNYESIEEIFTKHLAEIFNEYKQDNTPDLLAGIYCDRNHLIHYFHYVYKYREFLDALVICRFDVVFLNMLNEYIVQKWRDFNDVDSLYAFAGALYNMFHIWSTSKYARSPEEMALKLENIFL